LPRSGKVLLSLSSSRLALSHQVCRLLCLCAANLGLTIRAGRYSQENLSLAIQDSLLCFEMPLFAILHLYAFSHTDYISVDQLYAGRLPFYHAVRDSLFGFRDILEDTRTTFHGTGFSYRTFEPAEGGLHQGLGRERRVKAGLRYSKGGETKYWLPMPGENTDIVYGRGRSDAAWSTLRRPAMATKRILEERRRTREGYAPLEPGEGVYDRTVDSVGDDDLVSDDSGISFGTPEEEDDALFEDSRKLEFGDYNYPCVDASQEEARRRMRDDEEALVYGRRKAAKGKERERTLRVQSPTSSSGRMDDGTNSASSKKNGGRVASPSSALPDDCVDIVVEDVPGEQEEMARERRKGEPNVQAGRHKRVYRKTYSSSDTSITSRNAERGASSELGGGGQAREAEENSRRSSTGTIIERLDVPLARYEEELPEHVKRYGEDNPWGDRGWG
jgi:hypothetical protein